MSTFLLVVIIIAGSVVASILAFACLLMSKRADIEQEEIWDDISHRSGTPWSNHEDD